MRLNHRLTELETVARLLASDLAQRGLLTAKGRVRSSVSKWLEVLDRWDRFAQRIGVDRRPRQVQTLNERLAAMVPVNGTSAAGDDHDLEAEGEPNAESLRENAAHQSAESDHG